MFGFGFTNSNIFIRINETPDINLKKAIFLDIYPTQITNGKKPLAQLINFMKI